jgi:hypothetical protein
VGEVVSRMTTARIEVHNRWDAIDLARNLSSWRWYLVSQGEDEWDVVVGCDRQRQASRLLDTVQDWATRRHVESVVHLDDADIPIHSGI